MLNYKPEGEGKPIVLIHGYLENMSMWDKTAKKLSKRYKVLRFDLPGHGLSPVISETHDMESVAREIKKVMDKEEISEALVIGHSMGGYITLALADLFPKKVKAFILMNSSSLSDTPEKKELRARAMETAKKNLDGLIKMSIPLLFNEDRLDELKKEKKFARKMARSTPLLGVLAALKGMRQRINRSYLLNSYTGEIGIILGTKDRTVDPVPFKEVIPGKENISILELETGHMAYLEAFDETLKFIQDFAKKVFDEKPAAVE